MSKNRLNILFLLLICFISLFVFSSCSHGGVTVDDLVEEDNKPEEYIKENTGNVFEFTGEVLEDYKDLDVSDLRKFLGTAIVKVRPEEYQSRDIPVISRRCPNYDDVMTLAHFNDAWLDEYAISVSENTTRVYTAIIVKPKYGREEDMVNAINARLDDLTKISEMYPDQAYNANRVANGPLPGEYSDYFVYIVCDNAEEVYNQIYDAVLQRDLTILTPVPLMTEEKRGELEEEVLNEEKAKLDNTLESVEFVG